MEAWLARIVVNCARDIARRRKVRIAEELVEELALPFCDPAQSIDLSERLAKGLANLPDRVRSVMLLHDVQGFTHVEIANILGIPPGTSRSDLCNARRQMRKMLSDLAA